MDKIFTLLLVLIVNLSFSQELMEKTTDDFTGRTEMYTSWEVLFKKGLTPSICKYRFNNIDGNIVFQVKLVVNGGEVFLVDETMPIEFLMGKGQLVKFYPNAASIARKGGASDGFIGSSRWGASITYLPTTNADVETLSKNRVKKVRVHTDIGYVEDELKSKEQKTLSNSIALIL